MQRCATLCIRCHGCLWRCLEQQLQHSCVAAACCHVDGKLAILSCSCGGAGRHSQQQLSSGGVPLVGCHVQRCVTGCIYCYCHLWRCL